MTVPVIDLLPSPPMPTDPESVFDTKSGASLSAQQAMVPQINVSLTWIADQVAATEGYKNSAATSAGAASDSAIAANGFKNAAAAQVGLAADQVGLAANQVALANAAKIEAQSAAVASGAGAGFPVGREPFTALQINKAGAVSWGASLPDRATAQAGQSLMLDGDNLPKWAFAGQQIGDLLTTARILPTDFSSAQATLPASVNWAAVTYGKGLFVAVATSSNIAATSPDGINWTQRTLPASATWYAVTYGNGIFVAVGGGMTVIATSPDGITWTQRSAPVSATWRGVTYGGGLFVAVGISSAIAITSPDGINWTQRTLPASTNWYSVAYGNGVFVVTASSGSVCATSPDGITWTGRILPASYNLRGIAFGNGLFVAVVNGLATAISSSDGITWTVRTLPAAIAWNGITYGNGLFVAVAGASTIAATSPDGINWTSRTLAISATWIGVVSGGGVYAAIASNSNIAATLVQGSGYLPANGGIYSRSIYPLLAAVLPNIGNPAGKVWTATADATGSATAGIGTDGKGVWIKNNRRSNDNGVTFPTTVTGYAGGGAVLNGGSQTWVAATAANIYRSTDNGLSFSAVGTLPGGTSNPMLATDGAGTWIAQSYGGGIARLSKDDGATWTTPATMPSSAQGFCFIGANTWLTPNGYRSTDGGLTWGTYGTAAGQPTTGASMLYLGGNVVLVISSTALRRSTDGGFSWSNVATISSNTSSYGLCTDGSGGVLAVVSTVVLYSSDYGLTWQTVAMPAGYTAINFPAYGMGKFIITVGATGYVSSFETFDYDTVNQFKTPTPQNLPGMKYYIKAKEV